MGYRNGIGLMAVIVLVLALAFALLMGKDLRRSAQAEPVSD